MYRNMPVNVTVSMSRTDKSAHCQYSQYDPADSSYTELLIGHIALTSFKLADIMQPDQS